MTTTPVSRLAVRRTANLHTGGTLEDVTAQLHPELVDAAQALELTLNGKPLDAGVVEPSLRAVVESWVLRRDTSLVFEHALRIDVAKNTAAPLR